MNRIIFLTFTVLILTSCNAQSNKNDNGLIKTSQKLLRLINNRDSTAIFQMMWSEDAIKNKKGDIIKNDMIVINKYLDAIPDLKKLPYQVSIVNADPVNYAVVTILLQQGEESFKVLVYFSHPDLKHKEEIRNYDFEKTPKSYKVNKHLKTDNGTNGTM